MGRIREQELLDAADVLGVEEVSFLDYMDGDLDQADPTEAIGKIVQHLRRVRPAGRVDVRSRGRLRPRGSHRDLPVHHGGRGRGGGRGVSPRPRGAPRYLEAVLFLLVGARVGRLPGPPSRSSQ